MRYLVSTQLDEERQEEPSSLPGVLGRVLIVMGSEPFKRMLCALMKDLKLEWGHRMQVSRHLNLCQLFSPQ